MSVKNRYNIISVKPGTTVFAEDQSIYYEVAPGIPALAVGEGQFVVYNPKDKKSLGLTSIAAVDKAVFAVGYGVNPLTGLAKELRKLFMEETGKCDLVYGTAEPSRCGTAEVVDIRFDCIKPNSVYTINIEVSDYETEAFNPEFIPEKKVYSFATDMCSCEENCNPVYDCLDLVDGLVDQINGVNPQKKMDGSIFYPKPDPHRPFFAHKLLTNATQFCLTPSDSDCNICTHLPAITGITIGENTVNFTGTVDPEDDTKTLKTQLPLIKLLIDKAFADQEVQGFATYTGGAGECCATQIEINTEEETIALLGEGGEPIAPCGTSTPLGEYSCGIRVVAKKVDIGCLCDLPAETYIKNKLRKLNISAVGDDWACNSVNVTKVQNSTAPINLGYDLIELDMWTQTGGSGRGHWAYNEPRGRFGNLDARSRAKNTGIFNCQAPYCTINLTSRAMYPGPFDSYSNTIPGWSTIAIQMEDTANIHAIQQLVNAYIADSSCPIFKALECIDDADAVIHPETENAIFGGQDTTSGFDAQDPPEQEGGTEE